MNLGGRQPLRVLLVDDQHLVRTGFSRIFGDEEGLEVVGEAENGEEAVRLTAALQPDVVLMDVQMPVLDGIEATRRIVAEHCAKVVILTTFGEEDYVFEALQAGASGFMLKNADPDDIVRAIHTVADGHAILAPEVTTQIIDRGVGAGARRPARDPEQARMIAQLTEREREVLVLVARAMSNAEIAAHLVVGEATVKSHVSACLAKLALRDRVQAAVFAHESGLVDEA
ncbi:response regulator transcription factor [Nocardioides zeae]|uniref:Response regulator transcription factor n=1 Tax=Nocardioides imazamoxiresistens TaxID=3231893 RepID=A0ABU3PV92_9ACTN|nr:response regulator transcription factor [Nocardioides zeae]MDT9593138.1 response regulator transcription factor [Nocardioides zeae]